MQLTSRMEMRTLARLLLISVLFCFDPVTPTCIKDGKDSVNEGSDAVLSCMQKSMAANSIAVDGVIEFLCSYMKYKNSTKKEELKEAIENLEDATGCSTEDIFGSDTNLEQMALDENGVLTRHILKMEELLKSHVILPITANVCALLDHIEKKDFATHSSTEEVLEHKRTTRNILGGLGGLLGAIGGLGGLLNLLVFVGKLLTILEPVLTLVGGLLDGLGGVTNLVGGLGNGVTGLIGGLTGGLLGGGEKQGDLLTNLLGGVGGTLGGLTGTVGGRTGGLTGTVGGLTGGLTGAVGGLTGGLLGGGGGGLLGR